MNFFIYKITNTINSKVYIGQTTETLEKRFNRHISWQKLDSSTSKIHRAMKKYNISNFNIELLEECCDQATLTKREYFWIEKYDSINNGYNINNSGNKCGGDTLQNHPKLKEIGEKISNSVMGGKNHRSRKIRAINIITNEVFNYDSLMECVRAQSLVTHKNITRIAGGEKTSPYRGTWLFEYIE